MKWHARLRARQAFRCSGAECVDNCCIGTWLVPVDWAAYDRWQAMPPSAARRRLLTNLERIELDGGFAYALRRDARGRCVHLGNDGLCAIHARYGAGHLPEVCRQYPRLDYTGAAGRSLSSCYLSCPEVVRSTLFDEAAADGDAFEWTGSDGLPATTGRSGAAADGDIAAELDRLLEAAWQEPGAGLGARIACISRALGEVTAAVQQGRYSTQLWPELARGLSADLQAYAHGTVPRDLQRCAWFWRQVLQAAGSVYKAYPALGPEPFPALAQLALLAAEPQPEGFLACIDRLRTQARPLATAHAPVFARYFQVSLMNKGFPWRPPMDNYTLAWLRAVMPFAVVQLLAWVQAGAGPVPGARELTDIIYKVERIATHHDDMLDQFLANQELLEFHRYHACLCGIFPD